MTTVLKSQNANLAAAKESTYKEYMEYVSLETKAFTRKMIHEDMVSIYSKYYTDKDIKDYIKFYSSASGKKLVETMPTVQKELMTAMVNNEIPALMKKFADQLDQLKSKNK